MSLPPNECLDSTVNRPGQAGFYTILYNSLFSNHPTIRTILLVSLNKPRSSDQATELISSAQHTAVMPNPPLNSGSSHTDRPPQNATTPQAAQPRFDSKSETCHASDTYVCQTNLLCLHVPLTLSCTTRHYSHCLYTHNRQQNVHTSHAPPDFFYWVGLDPVGVYAFPGATIISKRNSLCRVFASLIGLDSLLLTKISRQNRRNWNDTSKPQQNHRI